MIFYKMNLVDIEKLSFNFFNQQVLFDINLDINENEKVLLIGANVNIFINMFIKN